MSNNLKIGDSNMKKMMILAMMMVMTATANAMSYNSAKNEALFLSDKMAYELNLTAAQYEAVYEINLDYLMSINGKNDVLGVWWDRRNADLKHVLTVAQYNKYASLSYFYRPLSWTAGKWTFNIYGHYANRNHFYKARPTAYQSYKGGNNRTQGSHYASVNKTPKAPAAAVRSQNTLKNGKGRDANRHVTMNNGGRVGNGGRR